MASPDLKYTAQGFLDMEAKYLGYHETDNNDTPFGAFYGINKGNWAQWCLMFMGKCHFDCGWDVRTIAPHFYEANACAREFKAAGMTQVNPNNVQPGDWLLIDWEVNGSLDHGCTALTAPSGGYVMARHGNLRDRVCDQAIKVTQIGAAFRPGYRVPAPSTSIETIQSMSKTVPPYPGLVREGMMGQKVEMVQQKLQDRGWRIVVDGDFGSETTRIVKAFQADKHITVDGVVGPMTWNFLWTSPVTK